MLLFWGWRQYVRPKRWYVPTRLQCITNQIDNIDFLTLFKNRTIDKALVARLFWSVPGLMVPNRTALFGSLWNQTTVATVTWSKCWLGDGLWPLRNRHESGGGALLSAEITYKQLNAKDYFQQTWKIKSNFNTDSALRSGCCYRTPSATCEQMSECIIYEKYFTSIYAILLMFPDICNSYHRPWTMKNTHYYHIFVLYLICSVKSYIINI
jgi:hypothetical protein